MKPNLFILSILLSFLLCSCVGQGPSGSLGGGVEGAPDLSGNLATPERDPVYVTNDPGCTGFCGLNEAFFRQYYAAFECLKRTLEDERIQQEEGGVTTCRSKYWHDFEESVSCEEFAVWFEREINNCKLKVGSECGRYQNDPSLGYEIQNHEGQEFCRLKIPLPNQEGGNPFRLCTGLREYLQFLGRECPQVGLNGGATPPSSNFNPTLTQTEGQPEEEPDGGESDDSEAPRAGTGPQCGPHEVFQVITSDPLNQYCRLEAWDEEIIVKCQLLRRVCQNSSNYNPEVILQKVQRLEETLAN